MDHNTLLGICYFAHEYQFEHITSIPLYPLGNEEADCAVQTVKGLLKKGEIPT